MILVVYVRKKENSDNREIIGFIPNAKVYGKKQSGKEVSRFFLDKKNEIIVEPSYSVEGDILVDLRNQPNKFEIEMAKYPYLFRGQRFYGDRDKHPELDSDIISYIENIIKSYNDDFEDQQKIQESEPATRFELLGAMDKPLTIVSGSQGKTIAKDARISKAALKQKKYVCQINPKHETFQTTQGVPYMEGHHLIPCTIFNAENYWNHNGKNIDCLENIVCICPTCHRAVHFGDRQTKEKMVRIMYEQQTKQLEKAGITITEQTLLGLYKC